MKIQINKKNVGLRIKQLRQDKGYTLEEFGKLLGDYQANKATVLGWENGRSLPNKERIKTIAKLDDKTVNELLYGSVEEFIRENYRTLIAFGATVETREGRSLDMIDALCPLGKYLEFYHNKKEEYNKLKSSDKNDNIDYFSQKYNINSIDELLSILRDYFFEFYSSRTNLDDDNEELNTVKEWMIYEVETLKKAKTIDNGESFKNSFVELLNSIDFNSQINIIEQMLQQSNKKDSSKKFPSNFKDWINDIINSENK